VNPFKFRKYLSKIELNFIVENSANSLFQGIASILNDLNNF
jgi:hypothetical protein